MPVTSGIFGKLNFDLNSAGKLLKIWYNSSTNAATVDVTMCNRSGTIANVRIAIIPAATDTVANEDFIVYDQPIDPGSTYLHAGIVMGTQETVYVYSDTANVSARVHGFVNDLGPAASDIGMATYVNAGLTQYASGFDITSEDKAATPKLVKAIVDAYGGSGGSVSVLGSGKRMWTVLDRAISSGYQLSVPTYQVNRDMISLFIDGVLCHSGNDSSKYAYREEGSDGSISTIITLYDAYKANTEICAWV